MIFFLCRGRLREEFFFRIPRNEFLVPGIRRNHRGGMAGGGDAFLTMFNHYNSGQNRRSRQTRSHLYLAHVVDIYVISRANAEGGAQEVP